MELSQDKLNQLKTANQEHILKFLDKLHGEERSTLLSQIDDVDFALISRLNANEDETVDWSAVAENAEPPQAARLDDAEALIAPVAALAAGEEALRAGQVGMILVAGGQGTRLGFQPPKGMFPIGPLSQRTLFQMHCDRLLAVMQHYGQSIPMFVMTSPATDDETRQYFGDNHNCGLSDDQLLIFCQGTMPAVDTGGRVLMASAHELALSPDGHGGLVAAMAKHGCLALARQRGIKYLFYAQVDNPLAELCDPHLIGYHISSQSQMTTQVVKKRFATEKVGNVVAIDGKVQIIEYSDLPDAVAEQKNADGSLKLWAGNIAVHVFDREFLESVVESADGLPFHRAHKKVAHVDLDGQLIQPEHPNATKFERFIFDLLPMASRGFVVEGDAARIFAPVKNADGAAVDTPQHCRQAICNLHRSWLQAAGATVADEIQVEIHPAWGLNQGDVHRKLASAKPHFEADTFLR